MKNTIDRKRAAAGEVGEMEGVALCPTHSLVAALRQGKTERRSSSPIKLTGEPVMTFVERRIGAHLAPGRIAIPSKLQDIVRCTDPTLASQSSFHLGDQREIVADIGVSDRADPLQMVIGDVCLKQLSKEPQATFHMTLPTMKLHPFVYRLDISRMNLKTDSVVFEMGLYSRIIDDSFKDYIGKIKVFFPRPHENMSLWIDLSHF